MKLIYRTWSVCALLGVPQHVSAQNASHAAHHSQTPPTAVTAPDAPAINSLRDAGVAQNIRTAALTAIAKSASTTVAAATLAEIEACDACLARNDLATILAAQPAADLKALAPTLVSKASDSTPDAGKDAPSQSPNRFVKAACIRAIFSLSESERPAAAAAWKPIMLKTTTVPGKMAWDPKEFTVAPGAIVAIEMINPDSMLHNMLLCSPGSLSEMGVAADRMSEGVIGKQRDYVPDSSKVLEIMGLTAPNTTGVLWFIAPTKTGTYPLICTYPGHWRMMNGKLKVQ